MKKAVVFDLFETLITEWGHEKYTKRQMCIDLGCSYEEFSPLWEAMHEKQYCGQITFEDSIRTVCGQLKMTADEARISRITARRKQTKAGCFSTFHPQIFPLLKELRQKGYRIAILSNCSHEEVELLKTSSLASMVDRMILSYEVGLCKPDPRIYHLAAQQLGVSCDECIFVGDGGSRELYGASEAGMYPLRAMWYIRQLPFSIKAQPEFSMLESPLDLHFFLH